MPDRFLTHRTRRSASLAMRVPDPGRYLAVDDGPEIVLIALRVGMTRIGRSASADVAFDDGGVSRRHAVVMSRTDGCVEVLDDGSLNGTFVNGERVRRKVLEHGDVLGVGRRRSGTSRSAPSATSRPRRSSSPQTCRRSPRPSAATRGRPAEGGPASRSAAARDRAPRKGRDAGAGERPAAQLSASER